MENPRRRPLHRIGINVLINLLLVAYAGRNDYFAGGNMFLYYSRTQVKNRYFRSPDFFVVLDVDGTRSRQGWAVWGEALAILGMIYIQVAR